MRPLKTLASVITGIPVIGELIIASVLGIITVQSCMMFDGIRQMRLDEARSLRFNERSLELRRSREIVFAYLKKHAEQEVASQTDH